VQGIALDVADDLPVDVELVHVPAAVHQRVQHPAVGQRGGHTVAQLVVAMAQRALPAAALQGIAPPAGTNPGVVS
jgi:hypothetical protein